MDFVVLDTFATRLSSLRSELLREVRFCEAPLLRGWCELTEKAIVRCEELASCRHGIDGWFLKATRVLAKCQAGLRSAAIQAKAFGAQNLQIRIYLAIKEFAKASGNFLPELSQVEVGPNDLWPLKREFEAFNRKAAPQPPAHHKNRTGGSKETSAKHDSLTEMMRATERSSNGRVVFTPEAYHSAKRYAGRINAEILKAVAEISDTLWKLYFDPDEKSRNLERDFQDRTDLELSLRESKQTNKSRRLMRQRKVTWMGKPYEMTAHVKVDQNRKHFRIYYAVEREGQFIVVGHCGDHLETAGSRYCK